MPLNIKDHRTDALARELARTTGESLTTAVAVALEERLNRVRGSDPRDRKLAELTAIAERAAALPVIDRRPADEVLGYDDRGLPS